MHKYASQRGFLVLSVVFCHLCFLVLHREHRETKSIGQATYSEYLLSSGIYIHFIYGVF